VRVACHVFEVELEGDYATVEGSCATRSRCGHETESFGTSDASIRRCLAPLREKCPNAEHNYCYEAADHPPRRSTADAAYERGYEDGHAVAARERRANGRPRLTAEQLRVLIKLTHPDVHPRELFELANRATAALLELLRGAS
jgi:hypothetical protein